MILYACSLNGFEAELELSGRAGLFSTDSVFGASISIANASSTLVLLNRSGNIAFESSSRVGLCLISKVEQEEISGRNTR